MTKRFAAHGSWLMAHGQTLDSRRSTFNVQRSTRRCVALTVLLLVIAAVNASAAAIGQREVLSNGMTLLASERRTVPIVTVSVLIQAGAYLDPPEKGGLASLTADLLTRGTRTRTATQIKETIEFVGGSLDAGASQGTTTISLSVLQKDLDLGLDLLADIILQPTFAAEEVQRRVQEVLGGIRRKHEDPGEVAEEAFAATLFDKHPLGRPPEGTLTTVPKITRDDVVQFHQTYYRPNRAILAVVGDVEAADFKKRLEARLGGWQAGGPPIVGPPPATAVSQPVTRGIQRDVTQASMILGHLGITRDNPDFYAVQVMNYILGGGGIGSRLVTKVREEQGWAYDVGSGFSAGKYVGTFSVSLQTANASADEALQAVLAEMRRMRDDPVSERELNDAKAFLTGSFPLRLDTNGKIAGLLVNIEYFGLGLDYPERYPEFIKAVTAADVQRVAQKYLHPDRYVLTAVADLTKAKIK